MAHSQNTSQEGILAMRRHKFIGQSIFSRTKIIGDGFPFTNEEEEESRVQSRHLPRNHWRGQEEPGFREEAWNLRARGCGGCGLLYPKGQSEAHRCLQDRSRGDLGPAECRELLWRRCAGWSGAAHGVSRKIGRA